MILKMIVVFCVMKYCSAEPPRDPKQPTKHAISSQSFIRHDVPLSYEYSAVHDYTSIKPQNYEAADPSAHAGPSYKNEPKSIQYAPIVRDEEVQNVLHLAAAHVAAHNKEKTDTVNVKNIEPKANKNHEYLSRNPGYEREIYQVVNKYPGHNAVYRQYPNTLANDKVNAMNYLNQFAFYQKENEHRPKYQIISSTQPPTMNIYDFVPKQYIAPSTESYNAVQLIDYGVVTPQPFVEAIKAQPQTYPFHPKTHRMLLNLARAYNVAHLPYKFNNKNTKTDTKDIPSHTQAILKQAIRLNPSETKTHLYPVGNNIFYP